MDGLKLQTTIGISAPDVSQTIAGLAPRSAPQSMGGSGEYAYGASGAGSADQLLWLPNELAASAAVVIDLFGGTAKNPLDETANLDTVKVFGLFCSAEDNGGVATAADGVTVTVNAALASALGFAGAFTKTFKPGESFYTEYATGRALTATGTVTITNLSGSGKARCFLIAAGFKP